MNKVQASKVRMVKEPGESDERMMARAEFSPALANTATARTFGHGLFGETSLEESVSVMKEKLTKVNAGNLEDAEGLLMAQAVALNAMFNELARRAALNMGEYPTACEMYLRMAFKAQGQCRSTLEALNELKNPRQVAFVKQANIANGPQQVNNRLTEDPESNLTVAVGRRVNAKRPKICR